jgi:hypothetical protein
MKTGSLTTRVGSLIVAAGLCALVATAQAQVAGAGNAAATSASAPLGASGAAKPLAAGSYREITWEALVPKDWDPMKQFRQSNFSIMNDGDPRATEMLKRMREAWDHAPTNNEMDGVAVRIPGYLVPLDESKAGLKEFLLVPYFGACIHTPPPPANQIILVQPQKPTQGFRSMDTVWVSGTLKTLHSDSHMGASGYRLESALVEAYIGKK